MLSKLLRLIGANVGRLTCKNGRWWLVYWRFYLLPNGLISILNACHVSQNNLHARVVKPWSRMIAYCMLNVNDKCTKHMIPWTKKNVYHGKELLVSVGNTLDEISLRYSGSRIFLFSHLVWFLATVISRLGPWMYYVRWSCNDYGNRCCCEPFCPEEQYGSRTLCRCNLAMYAMALTYKSVAISVVGE